MQVCDDSGQKNGIKKTKWTSYEDKLLVRAVETCGTESWIKISNMVPGRTGKQCRERWIGQLSPQISKMTWSRAEDLMLIDLHNIHGNKWTAISGYLVGRSAISVKNRWNFLIRHKRTQARLVEPEQEIYITPKPTTIELIPHDPLLLAANEKFGKSFEEFQAKLMLGNLPQAI